MLVSMYMTEEVITISPQEDGAVAVKLVARHGVRCIPVVDRGRLVGVISKSDILRCSSSGLNPFAPEARVADSFGFKVEDAMAKDVPTVEPHTAIETAAELLDKRDANVLVVVHDRAVVGVLTRTDILRAFLEIVFCPNSTRFTLMAEDGIDVAGRIMASDAAHELELRAYAEHRHEGHRYVFLAVKGPRGSVDKAVQAAWGKGVQVVQVQRP